MIRTVICFAFVVAAIIVLTPFGIATALLSFLGLRRPMSVFIYHIARGWALILLRMTGCAVTVRGRENIPRENGVCFVSNHGSYLDIVLLLAYTGRPIGFVAKKELLFIPLLDMWISVLGGLFIDRKDARSALRTIKTGIKRIKAGGGMIVFPEGHRSRDQGLLPFHSGSLKLATQAEALIVPVALQGTYNVFERQYRVKPGPVTVVFGKPINTAEIPPADRRQMLCDRIYAVIREALEE
jgi:1-acyl-sn-glycerol-3-phosphate acyltransferase